MIHFIAESSVDRELDCFFSETKVFNEVRMEWCFSYPLHKTTLFCNSKKHVDSFPHPV